MSALDAIEPRSHRSSERRPKTCRSILYWLAGWAMLLAATPLFAQIDAKVAMSIAPAGTPQIYGVQPTFYVRIYAPSNVDPVPSGTFSVAYLGDDGHYHYACLHVPIDTNAPTQSCSYGSSTPAAFNYHYVVFYSGDANYNGDTNTVSTVRASEDYPILKASPTFTLGYIPPIYVGQYLAVPAPTVSSDGTGGVLTGTLGLNDAEGGCVWLTLGATPVTPPCVSLFPTESAGSFTISLSYSGDANHNPYTNNNAGTLTVFPASTQVSIALGAPSITLGQTVSATASVASLMDPNARIFGTIQVGDGEVSCTITWNLGISPQTGGACNLTPISVGTRQITAKFVADAGEVNYAASQASATLIVNDAKTDGVCGSDNGKTLSAPPVNLCSAGTPGAVAGSGPWTWSCAGSNGGTTANCSAQAAVPSSYTISATVNPAATGAVTCTPNPVAPNGSSTCMATAAAGYAFSVFSGDCSGLTCTLNNVTANKSVVANFLPVSTTDTSHAATAPTLSGWMLALLGALLCIIALVYARKRPRETTAPTD